MQAAVDAGADALVVTHAPDVRYLSGFTGSSGAVALAGGRAALFTDGRYTTQAKAEAQGVKVGDRQAIARRAGGGVAGGGGREEVRV